MITLHESAGVSAVEVTAQFSEPIGAVTEVVLAEGSGIRVASRKRLRRLFSTARGEPGARPTPVKTATEWIGATLWLNLLRARSGRHGIVVRGVRGRCVGSLYVG